MSVPDSRSHLVSFLLLGVILGLSWGCGTKGPKVSPVTGIVLYKGAPLEGATVVFAPASGSAGTSPVALGTTDAQGRFRLRSSADPAKAIDGAVPGEYRVVISKFIPPGGMTEEAWQQKLEEEKKAGESGAMVPPAKRAPEKVQLLDPQYSGGTSSKLTAKVEADGKNDFAFDLK